MVIFYMAHCQTEVGGHIVTSWGFPSIHVAVPFSAVLQVLFIILESKPPSLHGEVSYKSLYQIKRGTDLQEPKTAIFYTPQLSKW